MMRMLGFVAALVGAGRAFCAWPPVAAVSETAAVNAVASRATVSAVVRTGHSPEKERRRPWREDTGATGHSAASSSGSGFSARLVAPSRATGTDPAIVARRR